MTSVTGPDYCVRSGVRANRTAKREERADASREDCSMSDGENEDGQHDLGRSIGCAALGARRHADLRVTRR